MYFFDINISFFCFIYMISVGISFNIICRRRKILNSLLLGVRVTFDWIMVIIFFPECVAKGFRLTLGIWE